MKLATLRNGTRDGQLVVVNRDLTRAMPVPAIAPTLQDALDDWARVSPLLREASARLNAGDADMPPDFRTDPLVYQGRFGRLHPASLFGAIDQQVIQGRADAILG